MTTKCAGMNCQSTDGTNHSPECRAEHAAAVAGGRFVKLPRDNANPQDLIALLRTFIGDTQIVRAAREAADLIEQQAARIAELEATQPVRTGDRLTDMKANDIIRRNGYHVTGAVLERDGARCIIELGAVRWLSKDEMWRVMHPDAAPVADSAMAKDAERYRWIKARARGEMYDAGVDLNWYGPTYDLDQQIDAALAASEPKNTGN